MKQILLFGAGKSATSLIRYLIGVATDRGWQLVVAENNLPLAESKIGSATCARAVGLAVEQEAARDLLVQEADVVISLLPPALHYLVALSCVKAHKHLLTASYVDESIRELAPAIRDNGLLFLCEMGLDPGIDHMSALHFIEQIKNDEGRIVSFHSHTGGLVAPESDDNPWHYKISWNPRNVVMAGVSGARYLEDGRIVTKEYVELFDATGHIVLPGVGALAWYPNRDSLPYMSLYGLEETPTFIRTTLRYPAFCKAWSAIVRAGLTDDKAAVSEKDKDRGKAGELLTFAEWSAPLLPFVNAANKEMLEFLGLFEAAPIPAAACSSADVLQYLLETRLAMQSADKDMIVMQHEISFTTAAGAIRKEQSTLVVKGEDNLNTAMARTVGLPLGIAAKLLLEGKITLRGLHIPIVPELYIPVLRELEQEGIFFERTLS
jgi:saccharopine dehydrogenase-like NADP-dependent oxidoreductase